MSEAPRLPTVFPSVSAAGGEPRPESPINLPELLEFPFGLVLIIGHAAAVASVAARLAADGSPASTQHDLAVEIIVLPGTGAAGAVDRRRLTVREQQIAGLVAQGLDNESIARRLAVSLATVRTHVHNSLLKLGFANRAQLAVWAASPASHPFG